MRLGSWRRQNWINEKSNKQTNKHYKELQTNNYTEETKKMHNKVAALLNLI